MEPPGLKSGVPRGGILERLLSILALKGKDFGRESINHNSGHMRKRTKAREFTLQVLYQMDITGDDYVLSLDNFWKEHEQENIEQDVKSFTTELVKGVADNLEAINKEIIRYATNWELKRIAAVDRNVLRLSCYELIFRDDIPAKVSINEAIELAKKYSSPEAGKFVNGILDKVKLEKNK